MILIVCLDLNNGMYFNNRRQSRDREVIKDIAFITKNNNLIMTEYSHKLFENECENIVITDDFKGEYLENDFCFVENEDVQLENIKKIIVYRWDKVYPSDYCLNLEGYHLTSTLEFKGYSHEKIVKEVYLRNEE
ncbi:ribonuclease Z [Eubacterium sp.]|uniref:ribonuclease Z n=1 Tax=Eubacterium sp. TaxID=142586 RepID=UPI0035227455